MDGFIRASCTLSGWLTVRFNKQLSWELTAGGATVTHTHIYTHRWIQIYKYGSLFIFNLAINVQKIHDNWSSILNLQVLFTECYCVSKQEVNRDLIFNESHIHLLCHAMSCFPHWQAKFPFIFIFFKIKFTSCLQLVWNQLLHTLLIREYCSPMFIILTYMCDKKTKKTDEKKKKRLFIENVLAAREIYGRLFCSFSQWLLKWASCCCTILSVMSCFKWELLLWDTGSGDACD